MLRSSSLHARYRSSFRHPSDKPINEEMLQGPSITRLIQRCFLGLSLVSHIFRSDFNHENHVVSGEVGVRVRGQLAGEREAEGIE